jgi:hypothetical protein
MRSVADISSVMLVQDDSKVTVYMQEHKYISRCQLTYSLPRVTSVGSGPHLIADSDLVVLP